MDEMSDTSVLTRYEAVFEVDHKAVDRVDTEDSREGAREALTHRLYVERNKGGFLVVLTQRPDYWEAVRREVGGVRTVLRGFVREIPQD